MTDEISSLIILSDVSWRFRRRQTLLKARTTIILFSLPYKKKRASISHPYIFKTFHDIFSSNIFFPLWRHNPFFFFYIHLSIFNVKKIMKGKKNTQNHILWNFRENSLIIYISHTKKGSRKTLFLIRRVWLYWFLYVKITTKICLRLKWLKIWDINNVR